MLAELFRQLCMIFGSLDFGADSFRLQTSDLWLGEVHEETYMLMAIINASF